MYKTKALALLLTSSLTSLSAYASESTYASERFFTPENISTALSLGLLSGEAKERAYNPLDNGREISQLNWKYKNAVIIKGNVDWDLSPWASLDFDGWTTLTSTPGQMDDYDWMDGSQKQWTDHSSHPDTRLRYANEFDLSIKGWILNNKNYRFGAVAGYQQSSFNWLSKGGYYNYSKGDPGMFEPGKPAASYQQKFAIPYIGLAGLYRYNKLEIDGNFKYSGWVHASGEDQHYLRDITFKSKTDNQEYYSLSASAGYYITDNAKVYLQGSWNRMLNKKGSTSIKYMGMTHNVNDTSGIEHTNFITTVGLKYSF